MKNLNIGVANKVATFAQRDGFIVCGNNDYQITFTFDSDWNGYTKKTARFKWNGGHKDVEIKSDNTVQVPIIENATQVEIGVYVKNLSTTTPAVIPCTRSILCGSPSTEYLTPAEVSNLEQRLLAACKMYRHKYEIMVGSYGVRWTEVEFIIYSTSPESLEDRDDFVNILDSAVYKSPFTVWLYDQLDGKREGKRIYISDNIFTVAYEKVESTDTGLLEESTYTVSSVEIAEA